MNYKDTINLPKTSFKMKANLSQKEPQMLNDWNKNKLYEKMVSSRKGNEPFILHDGPPYANGDIHIGTAFNKVLKDFIVKYKTMKGYYSPYIPGWDCHGMPIEHKVTGELGEKAKTLPKLAIREACRKYAKKYTKIQKDEFRRLGVTGDWDHPYLTMDYNYEGDIIRNFAEMVENGYIYRGLRPIHWCMKCKTALAEAEVEYKDHESHSIYVKFQMNDEIDGKPTYILIWTTTPWTLPANVAVAVHPDHTYVACDVDGEVYIFLKELKEEIEEILNKKNLRIIKEFKGRELENLKYRHPFIDRIGPVVLADYVTTDTGTGCVHTAPGHGYEDYQTGLKYKLPILSPVDEDGNYTDEFPMMKGMNVFEANDKIIELLKEKGYLLHENKIAHSYPHCWRCESPLIFRATKQWFLNVEHNDLRGKALNEIDKSQWIPSWSRDRIRNMMEVRPDWCLSRQRAWGVPLPVFYCKDCGEVVLDPDVIRHVAEIFDEKGSDAWFKMEAKDLLPEGYVCKKCGSANFAKEEDIFDVWFDASCSHSAVVERRPELNWPSDLYLEAVDQHRGWFQLSLISSIATKGSAPFKSVLTHGLILDSQMRKMSKKHGNVINPLEIVNKYGADILRLWFASVNYTVDVAFGEENLEKNIDAYRKLRNTFRFMLGVLYDFDRNKNAVEYDKMEEIDKYILHKFELLKREIIAHYDKYEFHRVYYKLLNFATVDLSHYYLDIMKDRLYTYRKNSPERRSAQTAISFMLDEFLRMIAPILVFTSDEAWRKLYPEGESIHLANFPEKNDKFINDELFDRWTKLDHIRDEVLKAIEIVRKQDIVGNSVEARVEIYAGDSEFKGLLEEYKKQLPLLFIVSQAEIVGNKFDDEPTYYSEEYKIAINVRKALGEKCERCWLYSETVGQNKEHATLCEKCIDAVTHMEE